MYPAGMSTATDPIRPVDVVADVVAATRRGTAVYCRALLHAPWGLQLAATPIASVHVVTGGACWLIPDGGDPIHLAQGDVALLPGGAAHVLADAPGREARRIEELIGEPLDGIPSRDLVVDGDGPATSLLCGGYLLDSAPRHPLAAALPPVIHLTAAQARTTGLPAAVGLLTAEVDRAQPGGPAVVTSLVDLLLVYLLRAWLADQRRECGGWVRALHDPAVSAALAVIHGDPAYSWSVASLARAAGVPRATFSRRFTALTGQTPMAYVTAWRMNVAARLLREHRLSLREVSRHVGYESEFAFARAFKRTVGRAPGQYRTADDAPECG